MLDAYLDESGIHDGAEICLIGGYFGGAGQWKKLGKAWKQKLEDFEVPLEEFHAKDLAKSNGFFHKWTQDDSYNLRFALAGAIAEFKLYPVVQGILVKDFFKLSLTERKFLTGATLIPCGQLENSGNPDRPYFAPFQQVVKRVLSYAPVGGKAHFFFGVDRTYSAYAKVLYQTLESNPRFPHEDRFGRIKFPSAKETPPLQAADLMVYSVYANTVRRIRAGSLDFLKQPSDLIRLLLNNKRLNDDIVYQDESLMRATIRQIPVELRGELLNEI